MAAVRCKAPASDRSGRHCCAKLDHDTNRRSTVKGHGGRKAGWTIPLSSFAWRVALAIGLLVGLERGWQQRDEAEGERTAGLRTYTLVALLGALSAVLTSHTDAAFLALSFLGFSLAFTAFSWLEAKAEGNFSVTGVVAGLITFALGAYAVLGELQVAIAAGVVVTLILR